MINRAMFRQVQAYRRQGYSRASIVKALGLDDKTVAKYFVMAEEDYRAYRQDHLFRDKAFDTFREEILEGKYSAQPECSQTETRHDRDHRRI
jgi:hypothetical protein